MAKPTKDLFKKLKKLPVHKRVQEANSAAGRSLLAALTPSQFAELFPRYYEKYLPDVGGFSKAISQKSQEQQQKYFDSIDESLGTVSPEARARAEREGRTPGRTSGGSSSGRDGLPNVGNMTAAERNFLGLVLRYESGNKNVPNYINDRTHTAQGYFQLTNTNWRNIAPELGITASSAMEATKEEQTRVALALLRKSGQGNWTNFNPQLNSAVKRGEISQYDVSTSTPGAVTPDSGNYRTSGGYVQPADPSLASRGNAEQCATLGKAFNPNVGHASGWNVRFDPNSIQPGVVLATMKYNDKSGGSEGAGYHTVTAMSGLNEKGMFLALEQSSGRPAHLVWRSPYNYGGIQGNHFGIINGHSERSMDALNFGHSIAGSEHKAIISQHIQTLSKTNEPTVVADPEEVKKIAPKTEEQQKAVDQIAEQGKPGVVVTAAKSAPTADVIKPNLTFHLDKESYLNEIEKKHPMVNAPLVGPGRAGAWKQTVDGLREAGIQFKETEKGIDATLPKNDKRIDTMYKDFKDNNLEHGKFLKSEKSAFSTGGETATVQKAAYKPDEDKSVISVKTDPMRQRIEQYYGKSISNHEYEMLLRATHGESTAHKHVPQEHAMIMGTILNRAKKEGGIQSALMRNKQFESVTGRTRGQFKPNAAYKTGPNQDRLESIYQGVINHLHNVPSSQEYFASATKKTRFGRQIERNKFGDHERHGDSVFGSKLGNGPPPNVVAQQTAPSPPAGIPMDSTVGRGEPTPTTPKQVAPEAPKPSVAERIQKEVFPGGGTKAQAAPTTPAPTTTPVATPTPVTPSTPAPSTPIVTPSAKEAGVIGASDGGSFNVGDGNINFYPLDKKDNMAAVDTATQQPLFTARSDENIQYDGQQNRVDVTPAQKNGTVAPNQDSLRSEFEALRQQMTGAFSNAGNIQNPVKPMTIQSSRSDNGNFVDNLTHQGRQPWNNPAIERAMNRITRMQEHGDNLNNHFSSNNTNA